MRFRTLLSRAVCIAGSYLAAAAPSAHADQSAPSASRLAFDVTEGLNLNSFLRDGPVAAHLLLRAGQDPRILVAFPAGNSGVGLWFSHGEQPAQWALPRRPQPVTLHDGKGRPLRGMVAEVDVTGAALVIKHAVLSSVRVLRDYQAQGTAPDEVAATPKFDARAVTWARDRLDGAAGYRLSLEVIEGEFRDGRISAGRGGKIRLKLTAVSGETALTPLAGDDLFGRRIDTDKSARNVLSFLSYHEKFLAGSWRFNTYFGRDTLMSVRLLMPALTPAAVEAGLGAVLTRLSPTGEVAHEEDIGEYAIIDHVRAGEPPSADPVFNYQMIDGTFMLGPVAEAWLLEDPRGRHRAAAFLAMPDGRSGDQSRTLGADLMTNLRLVLHSAVAFADDPQPTQLIGLKPGSSTGQWRDSGDGLGRGRYPYDVNAVFVPAALAAAGRFYASGLLDPYLAAADRTMFSRAAAMAQIWNAKAEPLFQVDVPNKVARTDIIAYAAASGVSADAARASIGTGSVRFHAVALDSGARAVPVVNSDEGFALLFGRPGAGALDQSVAAVMRPFPAGLRTDVGIVVANPAYAAAEVQALFTKNAYHGTVIWSWQQAVLAAGLERQLRRADLPPAVRKRVRDAQRELWRAIDAGSAVRNSELWSWSYEQGHYRVAPFGVSQSDVDESNAAQLWSTVYLAIPEPLARRR
jgi:hypothetical protein